MRRRTRSPRRSVQAVRGRQERQHDQSYVVGLQPVGEPSAWKRLPGDRQGHHRSEHADARPASAPGSGAMNRGCAPSSRGGPRVQRRRCRAVPEAIVRRVRGVEGKARIEVLEAARRHQRLADVTRSASERSTTKDTKDTKENTFRFCHCVHGVDHKSRIQPSQAHRIRGLRGRRGIGDTAGFTSKGQRSGSITVHIPLIEPDRTAVRQRGAAAQGEKRQALLLIRVHPRNPRTR